MGTKQTNMATSGKTTRILVLITFLCFATSAAFAQGPGFDDDVTDTPIDGGVTFMMAAAAGYGMKKLSKKQNSVKKGEG